MGSVAQVWFWRFPKVPPAAFDGRLRFQGGLRQAVQRRVHSLRKSRWMTALEAQSGVVVELGIPIRAPPFRRRSYRREGRSGGPAQPCAHADARRQVIAGNRGSDLETHPRAGRTSARRRRSRASAARFARLVMIGRRRPWRGVPAGNPSPVFLVDPARRPRSPIRTSAISSEAEWHESRRPSRVDPTGPSGVGYTIASFAKVRE